MDLYNNISNMKKCLIVFLIGISIVFSGCSKLSEPNNIDNPEILSWIWTQLANSASVVNRSRVNEIQRGLIEEFIDKVREQEIKVAGFETKETLGNEVLTYLNNNFWTYEWESFYHIPGSESKIESKIDKKAEHALSRIKEGDNSYLCSHKEQATELCKSLLWSFYRESGELVQERFKVLNWELDADNQGNGYTGYDIEYEVGDGWYVLLLLIEYDDDSKYEVNIIYSGTSLAEMNTYYQ